MKKGWKIGLSLGLVALLAVGGVYAYRRWLSGGSQEATAYVQSVSVITGIGPAGRQNRYSGVVEAKNIIEIDPDKDLTIEETFVSAGDKVYEGTPLFAYDVESLQLSYEQLQLDIQGLENGIETGNDKVESLKNQLQRARESKKYDIQMSIQTEELEVRKKQYELNQKRKQAQDMEKALNHSIITSPAAGTVRSVRSQDGSSGYGYGEEQSNAYITIVAGNDYCVKGTVSEQTIHTLQEGMPVRIMSRIDERTWQGTIYRVNTEETKQQNNNYYYYDGGSGEKASKYDFFVELTDSEGLLMGQHVYIEPGDGSNDAADGIPLPEYYVMEEGGKAFVYAADSKNRIEKRQVTLAPEPREDGNVIVTGGLSYTDRIAFPDASVKVGMTASETFYVPEESLDMGSIDFSMDMDMPDMEMDMEMPVDMEDGEVPLS